MRFVRKILGLMLNQYYFIFLLLSSPRENIERVILCESSDLSALNLMQSIVLFLSKLLSIEAQPLSCQRINCTS